MPQQGLARATKPAWDAEREAFGLQVARVVASNWQDHTVDLVTPNGASLAHVPIVTSWAGTDYGELSRPQFTPRDNGGVAGIAALPDGSRDCHALIAFAKGLTLTPVVLGFFYPSVSQMMLDGLQKITRHVGGTYSAVSLDGDIWFGFNPDGSYVGFHNDNPSPPLVYGTDYDGNADPSGDQGKPHSFTAMLRNGTTIHLDGQTGNVILNASQFMQLEGHDQLDLLGRVVTLTGLPAIYPGTVTTLVAAPSTDDSAFVVPHLAANAAWEYVGPVASRAPDAPLARTGWTFLGPGDAVRLELTGAGTPRFWKSATPGRRVGDPVEWAEVPFSGGGSVEVTEEDNAPDVTPVTKLIFPNGSIAQDGVDPAAMHIKRWKYLVPPDQPYTLTWGTLGNQTTPNFIVPFGLTFNARVESNGASGSLALQKNNSAVTNKPDATHPLAVVAGDKLRVVVTGAANNNVEFCLTIIANPADIAAVPEDDWFSVDLEATPIAVEPV